MVVGSIIGLLLVVAWVAWGVHVWSEHGARQGIGALIAWAAIAAILAAIVISLVGVYLFLRPSERAGDAGAIEKGTVANEPKAGDGGDSEPEAEATAN